MVLVGWELAPWRVRPQLSGRSRPNAMAELEGKYAGQIVIHGDFNDDDEQIARDFGVHPDDD